MRGRWAQPRWNVVPGERRFINFAIRGRKRPLHEEEEKGWWMRGATVPMRTSTNSVGTGAGVDHRIPTSGVRRQFTGQNLFSLNPKKDAAELKMRPHLPCEQIVGELAKTKTYDPEEVVLSIRKSEPGVLEPQVGRVGLVAWNCDSRDESITDDSCRLLEEHGLR